jgi:hypothetical protein
VTFDDSKWASVGLPHSFSIPYFGSPHFYTGYGWYRRHFDVPASWDGRRIFLEFDGVFQEAKVFVNGRPVGVHRGGYTGFSVEITPATHQGDNILAVSVNNLWNAQLAPRAGEHVFSGGIYRDVRLVVANPLHVTWYGTFVTTPQLSAESGNANIKTEVTNASSVTQSTAVRSEILDPANHKVASVESRQSVAAGATIVFDQTTYAIPAPQLWSLDHPALYSVHTTVLANGEPTDEFTTPFGFRWIKWTADHGFFLNGKHIYITGANVHQDHAGWGDAVTDAALGRDVAMVKAAGFNFIRGSHYPHAPAFSGACDRSGVMLWCENTFWGMGGFGPDGYWNSSAYPPRPEDQPGFEASVKQELREMIRIHRNHPSIVAWSMGNETFFSAPQTIPQVRGFLKDLVALTHELDPTRPAAIGGVQRPLGADRVDMIGDVAGYNGDGSSIPAFQNPGVPSLVSEYSSVTTVRPGKYEPGWGSLAKDQGKEVYPWRSGQAIWCMFDHGSLAGDNLGRMGIVDYFRIPKREWYWYRNEYAHIPPPPWPVQGIPAKLSLVADRTTVDSVDGTDDVHVAVTVVDGFGRPLSNEAPITLSLVSGPGEFPTGPSITFEPGKDIAMRDGKAAIEFRSYFGGASLIRATSPGINSADLSIIWHGQPEWIPGVTPVVPPRPYHRYTGSPNGASPADDERNLAADRPTRASSSAPGSLPANATGAKPGAAWQAAASDFAPWLQVDLENTYTIRRVALRFPSARKHFFKILVSANGNDWTKVIDQSKPDKSDALSEFKGAFGKGVRFIRVTFDNPADAVLSEVIVGGATGD